MINPSFQSSATLPQISSFPTPLIPTKTLVSATNLRSPWDSKTQRLNQTEIRSHLLDELASWEIHANKIRFIRKARKRSVWESQNRVAPGLCCLSMAWQQYFECLWNCWVLKKTLSWWLEVVEEKQKSSRSSMLLRCIKLLPERVLIELVLNSIELLIDRRSKLVHNVRYNMMCIGSYLHILPSYHHRQHTTAPASTNPPYPSSVMLSHAKLSVCSVCH